MDRQHVGQRSTETSTKLGNKRDCEDAKRRMTKGHAA